VELVDPGVAGWLGRVAGVVHHFRSDGRVSAPPLHLARALRCSTPAGNRHERNEGDTNGMCRPRDRLGARDVQSKTTSPETGRGLRNQVPFSSGSGTSTPRNCSTLPGWKLARGGLSLASSTTRAV